MRGNGDAAIQISRNHADRDADEDPRTSSVDRPSPGSSPSSRVQRAIGGRGHGHQSMRRAHRGASAADIAARAARLLSTDHGWRLGEPPRAGDAAQAGEFGQLARIHEVGEPHRLALRVEQRDCQLGYSRWVPGWFGCGGHPPRRPGPPRAAGRGPGQECAAPRPSRDRPMSPTAAGLDALLVEQRPPRGELVAQRRPLLLDGPIEQPEPVPDHHVLAGQVAGVGGRSWW